MNAPEPYAESTAKRINPDTQREQTSAEKTLGSGNVTGDTPDRSQPIAFRETRNAVSSEPVAWAVYDGKELMEVEFSEDLARACACHYGVKKIVPLYAAPQGRVVRLPKEPTDAEISELCGYAWAMQEVKKAMEAAGVKWEVGE